MTPIMTNPLPYYSLSPKQRSERGIKIAIVSDFFGHEEAEIHENSDGDELDAFLSAIEKSKEFSRNKKKQSF